MLGVEFGRFVVMLYLANVFIRLVLSQVVRMFPNSDAANAIAFGA